MDTDKGVIRDEMSRVMNSEDEKFLVQWLVESNKQLAQRNRELLVENLNLTSQVESLQKISFIDFATGIHNRGYLQQRLDEEFSRSRRTGSSLSCLFIDLDDFKRVNDTYGHLTGDRLLRDVAMLLKSFCRREDVLVRFGGEEFVLLMSCTGNRKAQLVAERIRTRTEARTFDYGDFKISITISIGISTLKKSDFKSVKSPEELIWTADRAMYEVKQHGKNHSCYLPFSSDRHDFAPAAAATT
jgi:two-component system cell cycle response regulator